MLLLLSCCCQEGGDPATAPKTHMQACCDDSTQAGRHCLLLACPQTGSASKKPEVAKILSIYISQQGIAIMGNLLLGKFGLNECLII